MKIKVCHFTTVHRIDDRRIFDKECTSLAAHGFDVTFIACGNIAFEDIKNDVKRISLELPIKNRLERFLKRSRAIYRKALEIDADIYHFHDPELLPVGLKLKMRNKKVIFDSHEFYGEQIKHKKYIPSFIRPLISNIYKIYETYVCKKLDAVIQVCTLDGKDYFESRSNKTVFIRNVPILKDEEAPSSYNGDSVALIGSLTYDRGITHMIKAASIASVPLILGGNFDTQKYFKEVKSLKEYSNVHYKGYVNQAQSGEILKKCFAGLSTGLKIGQSPNVDTLPTKAYDYMAAGIPFIISNTKFKKDIIEKYNIGITVDPNNVNEIASAILFLKNNKDVARQMGINGRKAYETEFNWQIEEKKLIALYKSILKPN